MASVYGPPDGPFSRSRDWASHACRCGTRERCLWVWVSLLQVPFFCSLPVFPRLSARVVLLFSPCCCVPALCSIGRGARAPLECTSPGWQWQPQTGWECTSASYGGAIFCSGSKYSGDVTIAHSVFTNNRDAHFGGAVVISGQDVTIAGSVFTFNQAGPTKLNAFVAFS